MLQILGTPFIRKLPNQAKLHIVGLFLCDCGNKFISSSAVRNKKQLSCGCKGSRNTLGERKMTHNMSKTNTYYSWTDMKKRVFNDIPRYAKYKQLDIYSGWVNSFENFLSDMGECPKGLTLERIDNLKGYSKENCKWATRLEQGANTSRVIKIEGKSLRQYCKDLNIGYSVIHKRITYQGYSLEEAISKPIKIGNLL